MDIEEHNYKEELQSYYDWLDTLVPLQKERIEYIMIKIYDGANINRIISMEKFELKSSFALGKYKSYKEFEHDELFKACEELTKVDINMYWPDLHNELILIRKEIDIAKKEKSYNGMIDHDEYYELLFRNVLVDIGLMEEYLNADINLNENTDWMQLVGKLKQFKEITDLLGRFMWSVYLLNSIELKLDNYSINTNKEFRSLPTLPECFVIKEDFFKYLSIPQVTDLYDIDEKGNYYLKQGKKAFLAGFAHTLKNKGKLIDTIKSSQDLAKVFCSFFHVPYNKIEEKQFQPDRAKIEDFFFIK